MTRHTTRKPRGLRLESLEARRLMAADIRLTDGVLFVQGTQNDDLINLMIETRPIEPPNSGDLFDAALVRVPTLRMITASVESPNGDELARESFSILSVKSLSIRGEAGADRIVNKTGKSAAIFGGAGNDTIYSGSGDDQVFGDAGNDIIYAEGGADRLYGGPGDDRLYGGSGNDAYYFDADVSLGIDTLDDPSGIDRLNFSATTTRAVAVDLGSTAPQVVNANLTLSLYSGTAFEAVTGGSLDDVLIGNVLANVLMGGPGNDTLCGGAGNDTYRFDADLPEGADTLDESGGGTDTLDFSPTGSRSIVVSLATAGQQTVNNNLKLTLSSGAAFENVIGGSQNDALTGNSLNNAITGGNGNDILAGGAGNDTYRFDVDAAQGADVLRESAGIDTLDFSATTGQSVVVDLGVAGAQTVHANLTLTLSSGIAFENVLGGALADVLVGNALANALSGRGGDDRLDGRAGNDTLKGDDGSDRLQGGDGRDVLFGGAGDDVIWGGAGDDSAWGGAGDDVIYGEQGRDSLFGDEGTDWLDGGLDYDRLVDVRAQFRNGENVEVLLDQQYAQDDDWSCGPNSGSRILRSYGHSVSYSALRDQTKRTSELSDFGFGTTPGTLLEAMRRYEPGLALQQGSSFDSLLAMLGSGRPVAALVKVGTIDLGFDTAPKLHWIAVSGFDLANRTITYVDTNLGKYTVSFDSFQGMWNWSDAGPSRPVLDVLGVKTRTFIA